MHKRSSGRAFAFFAALTWGMTMWSRTAFNYYTDELGISAFQLGTVNFMTSLGSMCGAMALCRYADRKGRRMETLGGGLLVSAAMQFVIAGSSSFAGILIGRLAMGFFAGCVYSLAQAVTESKSSPKARSGNAGIVENGEAVISNTVGPAVIVVLIGAFGWRMANCLLAVPVAVLALSWIFTGYAQRRGQREKEEQKAEESEASGGYKRVWGIHNMRLCVFLGMLALTNIWTMYIYCPMYWSDAAGYGESRMSAIMTGMGLSGIAACVILPVLANKWGRKKIAAIFAAMNGITYFCMFLMPGTGLALLLFLLFAGSACTLFMFFTALIPAESVPAELSATAISLVNASSEMVGGALSPLLTGKIAEMFGTPAAMLFAAVSMGIIVILVLRLEETNLSE